MENNKTLKFTEFEALFEADKGDAELALFSQIMSAFYDLCSTLLPEAPDYKDIVNDLAALAGNGNESDEDLTGKTVTMNKMIDSLISAAEKNGNIVADTLPLFRDAGDKIIEAYKTLLGQYDENTPELKAVDDTVSKSAVIFTSSLKDTKKDIRENLNSSKYDDILFEARNMRERNELTKRIISTIASIESTYNQRGLKSLKGASNLAITELKELSDKLDKDNEEYWKGLKRIERKDEFTSISKKIDEIGANFSKKSLNHLRNLDSNSEATKELLVAIDKLREAKEKMSIITLKDIQDANPTPEEIAKAEEEMGVDSNDTDSKEGDKDSKKEYLTIDPDDIENSRKSGKNRDIIKEYQEKVNEILKDDDEYTAIKADGLYGKNTKNAIKQLQVLLNKLGAGLNVKGTLSAQTQKSIDGFIENKDNIAGLLKNKA